MTDADKAALSTLRRRRGVVRASITRLATRLVDLEGKTDQPSTLDLAHGMSKKLETLDSDFKVHHLSLVDAIKDEEAALEEQEVLDDHDDKTEVLAARIKCLIVACSLRNDSGDRKVAARKLARIEGTVASVREGVSSMRDDPDPCLLRQYDEQLQDVKVRLGDVSNALLSLDVADSDKLCVFQARLEKEFFDCGLEVKKQLSRVPRLSDTSSTTVSGKGVKLPKLEVPMFDGNIINWRPFWEQFVVSIHERSELSDSEKLVYLQHSLKDGTAKGVIEGLSRSGEYYKEAIESLKTRYDRPRLIHQTHVRMILDAPSLKDGTGRELRRLHDTIQQHLRALKAMGHEPSGPFITSAIEMKLDANTMFEWQRFSQDSTDVPHYQKILEFLNLRAQASEGSAELKKPARIDDRHKKVSSTRPLASFAATATDSLSNPCIVCKIEKHPLYSCSQFKALPHDKMISILKAHGICLNCLRPGHFIRQCKSAYRCKKCQKPHHTLLHVDAKETVPVTPPVDPTVQKVTFNTSTGLASNLLLMTCRVLVHAPDGSSIESRALLDSASSASFVSERLVQSSHLPRFRHDLKILSVAGVSHTPPSQAISKFVITPMHNQTRKIDVTAAIVPRVTCDLPLQHVPFNPEWEHLSDLTLADPDFGVSSRVDLLLGVDIFAEVMRHGRRCGAPGSPSAFETDFGWVLAGETSTCTSHCSISAYHVSVATGGDVLQRFWEEEEPPSNSSSLTLEERAVTQHFEHHHFRNDRGQFVVPLPKKLQAKPIGESRSQAVRRYFSLERSLHSRQLFDEFRTVIEEYFEKGHSELVPSVDLERPAHDVFYLPMHAVRKESSSTTKVRAVFDASAASSTGVSLNDTLLVGPTVHAPLVDVLLQFRLHRIALVTDVSRMYRAVLLDQPDKDLHRFVWRRDPSGPLRDYRMTRLTFGVSASSYAANMAVRQNATDFALEYPAAAKVVEKAFYVDDGLTGADTIEEAVTLQRELQELFGRGGFLLRKWNCSNPTVLEHVADDLKDPQSLCSIPDPSEYTKTLGIEWNTIMDHFRLTISKLPPLGHITKRFLVSDVAKTFDVLGWVAPCTIKMKILFQQLWELKIDWDESVPDSVRDAWTRWRSELSLLSTKHIPRCYYDKGTHITSMELHGFCDASEQAYAAVLYLRMESTDGSIQVALVSSKTKVAPIKKLTIPRLELCGAQILSRLLHHARLVFNLSLAQSYAWTDSTIVLSWLAGNPRRLKTYVCNRVTSIVELLGPDRWRHVSGLENPADCASRGLFPSELLSHGLWWNGPAWLKLSPSHWPSQADLPSRVIPEEEKEVSLHTVLEDTEPIIPLDRFSSFSRFIRITAWIQRFIRSCRPSPGMPSAHSSLFLTTQELRVAEIYWFILVQNQSFSKEMEAIKHSRTLRKSSPLIPMHPFLDSAGLVRVGGRERKSNRSYTSRHPIILHGSHRVTKLLIDTEHNRLLHAGPTLLACSLNRLFYIIGGRKAIRSITRACVTCRRFSAGPQSQMMGQLPLERVTPDLVFDRVGVDYAGPFLLKLGATRRPTIVKAYACVYVSLSVRAVHLELVSDLTTAAFIASLRRFIAQRGKPTLLWSDHGTNFVGASREIQELLSFLATQKAQKTISEFCTSQGIQWNFIPEHTPHFGGLWEAAVKSMKTHLRRVASNVKMTFEELSTLLAQVEACLNSRPLVALPADDDGIEALTPGHFLVGRPLEALPDSPSSFRPLPVLARWHLCQALVRHFWQRWSGEYLHSLRRYSKWHNASRNVSVGDVVILREDNMTPTKWPLARVIEVYPGQDGLVRVVKVKTSTGKYTRPIAKVTVLLPSSA